MAISPDHPRNWPESDLDWPTPAIPRSQFQQEFGLEFMPKTKEVTLKPLSLYYLLAIYAGEFDGRLHAREFMGHKQFAERIRELIDMGLIGYRGVHYITPKGSNHVLMLLEQKVI